MPNKDLIRAAAEDLAQIIENHDDNDSRHLRYAIDESRETLARLQAALGISESAVDDGQPIETDDQLECVASQCDWHNRPFLSASDYREWCERMRAFVRRVRVDQEPIETENEVERIARACGWDNRKHMTDKDYRIWCERMREFVRLARVPASVGRVAG